MTGNTLIIIGAVIAAIVALPFLLPSEKTVARSAVIDAPAADLYALIASNKGYQRFNPYKDTDPDLAITLHGPDAGVGSGFAFKGKEGAGTQTITAAVPDRSVTMQIDLGAMGRPVTTFTLEPAGTGTKVTWSTRSAFGMNPVGRVFGLFLDGMLGGVYERGLANLERAAAQPA